MVIFVQILKDIILGMLGLIVEILYHVGILFQNLVFIWRKIVQMVFVIQTDRS